MISADRCAALPGGIQIPLEPGDVLIMDALSLHRGGVPAGSLRTRNRELARLRAAFNVGLDTIIAGIAARAGS